MVFFRSNVASIANSRVRPASLDLCWFTADFKYFLHLLHNLFDSFCDAQSFKVVRSDDEGDKINFGHGTKSRIFLEGPGDLGY